MCVCVIFINIYSKFDWFRFFVVVIKTSKLKYFSRKILIINLEIRQNGLYDVDGSYLYIEYRGKVQEEQIFIEILVKTSHIFCFFLPNVYPFHIFIRV